MLKSPYPHHVPGRHWARATALMVFCAIAASASAQNFNWERGFHFWPGNLVVSRSVYDNKAGNVSVGELLPPGCATANCVSAVANGLFPYIFNNAPVDGSFGTTSRIFLDQITPTGWPLGSLEAPNSLQPWVGNESNQLVTSFSSKSELALNLSTDHQYITLHCEGVSDGHQYRYQLALVAGYRRPAQYHRQRR